MKTAAARAACRTGADRLLGTLAAADAGPLVLGYHQVVEDCARASGCIPPMLVSARTLERQLDWVGRHYRFVTLDELGERLASDERSARSLAAVTFDDGYRDVYEHAFPLLQRKGIPAAVFVVTDLVGTSRLQRHDRLHRGLARLLAGPGGAVRLLDGLATCGLRVPALERAVAGRAQDTFAALRILLEALSASELDWVLASLDPPDGGTPELAELQALTWDMVAEMHRAGITIGSHTRSHPLLTHETSESLFEELVASRRTLELRLRAPVRHFAYPDGAFDPAVVDAVAAAGYGFAYTTCRHRDRRHPRLTVPRRLFWESSSRGNGGFSASVLRCQVRGVFDLVGRCRRTHDGADRRRPA